MLKSIGVEIRLSVLRIRFESPTLLNDRVFIFLPRAWPLVHILGWIKDPGPKCVTARNIGKYLGILGGCPKLVVGRVETYL